MEYLVCDWWRLMVDSPLKSFGQQQSFWPWVNVITKNNDQFISGGKNKINLLSGCSCWSVLSILLDSQRTELGEVPRSMWYLFAEGEKQSEEQELCCWQRLMGCSCAARGDPSRMLHPRFLGPWAFLPCSRWWSWLWYSTAVPWDQDAGAEPPCPRVPCFPWMPGRREEFLLSLWQTHLLKGNLKGLWLRDWI